MDLGMPQKGTDGGTGTGLNDRNRGSMPIPPYGAAWLSLLTFSRSRRLRIRISWGAMPRNGKKQQVPLLNSHRVAVLSQGRLHLCCGEFGYQGAIRAVTLLAEVF
jgi:hypothetical protein